jgi:hypothetical protein
VLRGKVVSDNRDHADLCEIARCQRKVGSRSAQNIVGATSRSCDVVKRDRTNGEYAHYELSFQTALALRNLV